MDDELRLNHTNVEQVMLNLAELRRMGAPDSVISSLMSDLMSVSNLSFSAEPLQDRVPNGRDSSQ